VKRLILVSTVKVNGEATQPGHALVEEDAPYPDDAYGLSKYEAEQRIKQTLDRTGMELVIIRPPLIYGAGVRANFGRMVQCVHGRIPLPLGAIDHNLRSFVFVENLVDFIVTCLEHPAAAQETFFVSDGEDMSTADLLMRIGDAIGKPTRLFYVPIWLLRLGSILIGKRIFYGRLCNSLQVDISKAKRLLAWTPRFSVDEALRRSARWK
jgi:nucleoside-diphosphate-sugar epimerase